MPELIHSAWNHKSSRYPELTLLHALSSWSLRDAYSAPLRTDLHQMEAPLHVLTSWINALRWKESDR